MNVTFYIAKRYSFRFTKNSAINTITTIASVGIIVGTMCLFVVLSVFSGLKNLSLSYANTTDPDIRIETNVGKKFSISNNQLNLLKNNKDIAFFSKSIEEKALFTFKDKEQIAVLKGVDNQYDKVTQFSKKVLNNDWIEPQTNDVIVGAGISKRLTLGTMDYVNLLEVFAPKPGKGLIESETDGFNQAVLNPINIYFVNEDYDQKYIIADIGITQQLLNYKNNEFTYIEIKTKPNVDIEKLQDDLKIQLGKNYLVKNRAELNESLYKMLNTENIAVYLIFTLVVIIALFNLAGSLIMMIIEKKQNLKTLYHLGMKMSHLKNIFFIQGNIITVIGSIVGLLLGIGIVALQQNFNLVMLTPEIAYPVVFENKNIVIVLATILILGFLTAWLASSRITKNLLEK